MAVIYYILRMMAKLFILVATVQIVHGKDLNLDNENEFLASVYIRTMVKPIMKFYFFNLTNPEEFLNGATPVLNEVGPFAYKAKLVKENVRWINDGLIEFIPKVVYRYYPKKSKSDDGKMNRQFDKITTINMPLISALNSMKNTGDIRAQRTIASFVEILGQKPYVTHTARDLLWGYDNQLLGLAKTINNAAVFPEDKVYPYDQFGYFIGKNDTSIGTMRVATGLDNSGFLAEVKEWKDPRDTNFNDHLGIWEEGSQCDKTRGSDGFVFPKNIKKNSRQMVFNRNFCRSLSFTYKKDITDKNGINGYRFVASSDNFNTVQNNPENSCFCTGGSESCNKYSGLYNISSCQYDAPVLVSWPHFFQADKALLNDVKGLKPDATKHECYYDISKNFGVALGARITTQINAKIDDYGDIEQVKGLKPMVFPIMWSSIETDGIKDSATIERFKKINV